MVTRIGLGLRGQKGGAVAVALAIGPDGPHLLRATMIATHDADDRLAIEPYRVAYEMTQAGGDKAVAAAIVADARGRQDACAEAGLRALLAAIGAPAGVGLLVNRAGWVTDLLDYSLGWADHVPVAEALAVREAIRAGLRACATDFSELDEKSLPAQAEARLDLASDVIETRLTALGAGVKPWRREQKLAALAAWLAAIG